MEHQLSQQDIANWAMIIITVGALAIGLISMLVGQLMRAIDWWRDGVAQAESIVMSKSAENAPGTGSVPAGTDLVPAHQYQAEAGTPRENVPAPEPPRISHNLEQNELIILLTVQKRDGAYRFSANEIAALVGGKRSDVLDLIASVRNPPKPAEPPMAPRLDRPPGGWPA